MKKLALIIALLSSIVFASIFEDSFKIYPVEADNLYMTTLSAINASSKFEVVEMQSKNGYILFLYGQEKTNFNNPKSPLFLCLLSNTKTSSTPTWFFAAS